MDSRTVGIVGGGQLGRMMAEAALRIGVKIAVLDPLGKESPAGQVAELAIEGACMLTNSSEEKTRELAAVVDLLTVEIEHVDTNILAAIEQSGKPVQPTPATIRMIQDKLQQKQHLAKFDIALPDFMDVPDIGTLKNVGEAFGYPFMLKSRTGAYDGHGNFVVKSASVASEAFEALGGNKSGGLYAERWVPFEKELAVMVARSATEVQVYPVVETTQKDNICHTVVAPAQVTSSAIALARDMAERAITSFDGFGIFGIEMFLLKDGQVLLNEIAPRPHNSGHYTMEACPVDQFENHLRAILGLPLGKGEMDVGAAIMLNILGEPTMEDTQVPLRKALSNGKGGIHWYGKSSARKGRKMAHCTFVGPTLAQVQKDAESIGVAKFGSISPSVAIIMGSDSDLPTMKAAAELLEQFSVSYEMTIVSAHRTPDRMYSYARSAAERGIKVIIAGAGGAAHLPGMVAALTPLPVIGVPVKSSTMNGLDSLYSIVQMPRGIPVATVAIGNAMNAGLLAVRMLSINQPSLLTDIEEYMRKAEISVCCKAEKMTSMGLSYSSED